MLLHGAMASGKLACKRNVPEPIPQISVGLHFGCLYVKIVVCRLTKTFAMNQVNFYWLFQ